MWLAWKGIGLELMIIVFFLLVYWQRRHWRSPATELGIITITMMFFDWIMTWFGQSASYWQRTGRLAVNELNPFGDFLLGWHPMIFAAAFIFYMILIIALIRIFCRWSRFLMIFVGVLMTLAHGYCAFEWVFNPPYFMKHAWIGGWVNDIPLSYLPFIILALIVGILLIRKKRNRN